MNSFLHHTCTQLSFVLGQSTTLEDVKRIPPPLKKRISKLTLIFKILHIAGGGQYNFGKSVPFIFKFEVLIEY